MSDNGQPSESSAKISARRSARMVELLNDSPRRKPTPLGVDTAWALKMKDAINAAVRELHVQVLSAKPICTDGVSDSGNMRFELETDRGPIIALRHRDGSY